MELYKRRILTSGSEMRLKEPQKRDDIQILRALAIIGVVCIHTCPEGIMQVFFRPLFNYSVSLFLFISGYLTRPKQRWFPFYKKRILRTFIPYLIWTTISVLIYTGDYTRILRSIMTFGASTQMYYIFVYISLVVITPLAFVLGKSKVWYLWLLITPLTAMFVRYDLGGNFLIPIYRYMFTSWFAFYYLGIMFGNFMSFRKAIPVFWLVALYIISLIFQLLEGLYLYSQNDQACGTQLKMTAMLSSIIAIFICLHYIKRPDYIKERINDEMILNKILLSIGDYSFGIFLIHMIVLYFLRFLPYYDSIPYLINSVIVLLLSWLLCMVLDKTTGSKYNWILGLK